MLTSLGYPDWLVPLVGWSAAALLVAAVVGHAVRPKYRRLFGRCALGRSLWNALLPSMSVQIYLWIALVVLWTPVWWLARAGSELTGLGSATAWFVVAVVALSGGWLVRGLAGRSVNRAFVDRIDLDDAPAGPDQAGGGDRGRDGRARGGEGAAGRGPRGRRVRADRGARWGLGVE